MPGNRAGLSSCRAERSPPTNVSRASLMVRGRPCVSSQGIAANSRSKRISLSMRTVPPSICTVSVPARVIAEEEDRDVDRDQHDGRDRRRRAGMSSRRGITVEDHTDAGRIACCPMAQLDAIRSTSKPAWPSPRQLGRGPRRSSPAWSGGRAAERADPATGAELVDRSRENTERILSGALRSDGSARRSAATKADLAELERKVDRLKTRRRRPRRRRRRRRPRRRRPQEVWRRRREDDRERAKGTGDQGDRCSSPARRRARATGWPRAERRRSA